jgi:hypothetical protein
VALNSKTTETKSSVYIWMFHVYTQVFKVFAVAQTIYEATEWPVAPKRTTGTLLSHREPVNRFACETVREGCVAERDSPSRYTKRTAIKVLGTLEENSRARLDVCSTRAFLSLGFCGWS